MSGGVSKEEEDKSDEYSQDMTQAMGAGMETLMVLMLSSEISSSNSPFLFPLIMHFIH